MELVIVILSSLMVVIATLGIVFGYLVIQLLTKQFTNLEQKRELENQPQVIQDQYTPENADNTVPLDQWTPDFTKPVTVTKQDEEDQYTNAESLGN